MWLNLARDLCARTIKIVLALGSVAIAAGPALGQGLQVTAGESFTYEFTSMQRTGSLPGGAIEQVGFSARFAGDLLDPGDSVRLEMFENTVVAPFQAFTFNGLDPGQAQISLYYNNYGRTWNDLQGVVRLTLISGSATLERVIVFADLDDGVYATALIVPEPSSIVLICSGVLALGFWLRKTGRVASQKATNDEIRAG